MLLAIGLGSFLWLDFVKSILKILKRAGVCFVPCVDDLALITKGHTGRELKASEKLALDLIIYRQN